MKKVILFCSFLFALSFQSCVFSDVDDPVTIKGVVTVTDGLPVAGAQVEVKTVDGTYKTQTSASGEYRVANLSGGAHGLIVKQEGYLTVMKNYLIEGGETRVENVRLRTASEAVYLYADPEKLVSHFPSSAGTYSLAVVSNMDWDFTYAYADWFTIKRVGNSLVIKRQANHTGLARPINITLVGEYNRIESIVIVQNG